MDAQALLQKLQEAKTPAEQWEILQSAPPELRQDPEVLSEEQWWLARYKFMDRKRTRVQDKFIWMLMYFSTWTQQNRLRNLKELYKVRDETMAAPEMEAVLESPELYTRLYDAANTYVKTMAAERLILGIMPVRAKSPDHTNNRIARELVSYSLLPLAMCCKEYAFTPHLVRAMYNAALQNYEGIRPFIIGQVEQIENGDDRGFVMSCIDDVQDLYGGSNI